MENAILGASSFRYSGLSAASIERVGMPLAEFSVL
jgi:hypothetical protein